MADERQQKRLRRESLQDVLHTGGTTTRALHQIMSRIREQPEILDSSMWELRKTNLEQFLSVRHVEPLMLRNGLSFNWEMCNPNRMLAYMVQACPRLQEMFVQAARTHVCSADKPWSLIIGFDEFCPGNKLKVNNQRKCMVLSFNFIELGKETLWHENYWLTPVCVRHNVISQVPGGWSHMFRKYLQLHLMGPIGLSTAGVPLMLNGQHFLLFGKLKYLLGDGDGFRMVYDWRGANALKPCFRHGNVLSKGSCIASRNPAFVEISCSDSSKFQTTSCDELLMNVDMLLEAEQRVGAGSMTKTRFVELQKVCGLNCNAHGLLADEGLRQQFNAVEITTMDWVHTTMQDGTMTNEAFLLISVCEELGLTSMSELESYMKSNFEARGDCCSTCSIQLGLRLGD